MEVNPNSQQSAGTQPSSNNLGNIQRPGEYLRHVRLQKKHELSDVSQALNMSVRTLEALEKDEYTVLPEATFIKGYYRSYARYLNVDASMIIQSFDEIYQNDTGVDAEHALNDSPIKIMGKLPGSNSSRNRKWLKRIIVLIVIAVFIWLAIVAVKNWTNKKKQEQMAASPSNVQVLSLNQDGVSSGDKLEIKISEPTSVNIIDSTGKVLAQGRQTQALTLNGQSPFQIQLSDAKAVSLNLNGEAISLSPYTVNGKADFRLSR